MDTRKRRVLAVSLMLVTLFGIVVMALPLLGGPHFVPSRLRFFHMSQLYDAGDNTTYSVYFAGANFTFLYWHYLGFVEVENGTTIMQTDMPFRVHFRVEVSGWASEEMVIDVGGYVLIYPWAPLAVVTAEHNLKLYGVATADTSSLWNRWAFLVSL